MPVSPLSADRLYKTIDPSSLPYSRTDQATPSRQPVGQQRAIDAVQFGLAMDGQGYNLFCMGPEGTGKASLVQAYVTDLAATKPRPSDWVYVHNFATPNRPHAMALPAASAAGFAKTMDDLIDDLRHAIPSAFDSDQYRTRRRAIEEDYKARQDSLIDEHQDHAKGHGIALMRTPMGLALAPLKDGEVLSAEDFGKLPAEEQATWKERMEALQTELEHALRQVPRWEKEKRDRLRDLNREVADSAVSHLLTEIQQDWTNCAAVIDYLEQVHDDILDNVSQFLPDNEDEPKGQVFLRREADDDVFRRYRVNVLVTQSDITGAPVIDEDHPTQPNLLGRIEHRQTLGALVTDFNLIRAGALHRANGGFLTIDARRLLTQPFAWEDLKRALRKREIRIESPGAAWGMWTTQGMDPEPVPLDVKVILLGEPELFYLLSEHDPDFDELFKVVADFDTHMPRTAQTVSELATLLADMTQRKGLRPFDAGAIARVMEFGGRMVEDSERLSTNMGTLSDLMREADFLAGRAGAEVTGADHVRQAIAGRERRADRIPTAMREETERGTIHIATDGTEVGQINGLAVIEIGNTLFGRPCRISARVRLGRGDVIDIEREADLSGPLHSKGMMILSSFLASRFAEDGPLPLHASIVFEQSYGMIDGDSASSTEMYALLSALSEVPILQSLAVTGSVDQFGRVQAIGGVNEKIEGFFDLCNARGLTGSQGVLIPADNVVHLMLRDDVVAACAEGRFHIYPVETIDQGLELLTGLPSGERDEKGDWTPGTVNRRVAKRLSRWTRKLRDFDQGGDGRRLGDRS